MSFQPTAPAWGEPSLILLNKAVAKLADDQGMSEFAPKDNDSLNILLFKLASIIDAGISGTGGSAVPGAGEVIMDGTEYASLEAAINAGTAGSLHTIQLGSGSFATPSGGYSIGSGAQFRIIGSGAGITYLEAPSTPTNPVFIQADGAFLALEDLTSQGRLTIAGESQLLMSNMVWEMPSVAADVITAATGDPTVIVNAGVFINAKSDQKAIEVTSGSLTVTCNGHSAYTGTLGTNVSTNNALLLGV